eukprot:5688056-Amphidinium_carterae.2
MPSVIGVLVTSFAATGPASMPLVADAVAAVGGGNPPIVGTGVANLPFASHGVPLRANIIC